MDEFINDAQGTNIIYIYCDGACINNPGPGGWAAVLLFDGSIKKISGSDKNTTNNKMELTAAIEAIKEARRLMPECIMNYALTIYVDSMYVKNGITKWIHNWIVNGWRKGTIKNVELWRELYELTNTCSVNWEWVKAHSGNKYNEMADKLAYAAAELND